MLKLFDPEARSELFFVHADMMKNMFGLPHIFVLERPLMTHAYAADRTGHLIVDPYNDFRSEGGKLSEASKPTADALGMFDNLRRIISVRSPKRRHRGHRAQPTAITTREVPALIYTLALTIGAAAGLCAIIAPATVSWAAYRGGLDLSSDWLSFMGYRWAPWLLSVAVVAAPSGSWVVGLVAGVLGAVAGTYRGAAARAKTAAAFGSDRPAALFEDAVAIASAFAVIGLLS